ncbi:hypothetical protein ACW9YQ_19535 (plasmid) [Paraburkholderia strydomiana]
MQKAIQRQRSLKVNPWQGYWQIRHGITAAMLRASPWTRGVDEAAGRSALHGCVLSKRCIIGKQALTMLVFHGVGPWGCIVKRHTIFNLLCPCGHRGCIVESADENAVPAWHFNFVRSLSHAGDYEGLDPLFADVKPACPACGKSLGPEHVVARVEKTSAVGDMPGATAVNLMSDSFRAAASTSSSDVAG